MDTYAPCVSSRRSIFVITITAILLLTPPLFAESLLDKALNSPSSGTTSLGTTNVTSPAPVTSQPVAPVDYKAPAVPSVSSMPARSPTTKLNAEPSGATFPPTANGRLRGDVTAMIRKLDPLRELHERRFKMATAEFPAFCQDWQRKLEDRTHWNLSRISWHLDHGLESGTYTGYGAISSCTTKMSDSGVAIGKLTYDEYTYSLSGKSIDEAKHAQPKQVSIMRTLEIFRFDHGKWFE
jgi:hypothetical protein